MSFAKTLISWYLKNKRDLPWRETKDPYRIWLSEIILQQTRVNQGMPYYFTFLEEFPTVFDLANAPLEKVLKHWQGLGYYSRARNLHQTAIYVANESNGNFPSSYKELKKLKGIGEYTASAIASTCFDEPVAVVDGNVYRFLSRYFGIDTPINSTAGAKEFKELANELLDASAPGMFNQATIEFGAIQCKPQLPLCQTCPFAYSCIARKEGRIKELPVKIKKLKVKDRYFNYLVFLSEENKTLIEQRTGKGIWQGLYQFPLVETNSLPDADDLIQHEQFRKIVGEEAFNITLYNKMPVIHKLTHQHLHTHFWLVEKEELPRKAVAVDTLAEYPVPVLIANFLREYDF